MERLTRRDKRSNERIERAQNIALEERGLDYILEVREGYDFVEVVGSIGGDVLKYRIYDDETCYER